ncbi:hypothetical protein ID866_1428 [Astraeus odoratus]|nr:hypothetical protein ID866_1428 [Astraeus odoratus]
MISEKKTSPTSSLDRGTFRCRTGAIEFRQHTTSDSPCSSSATLVDDDHLQADVYKLILSPENQQYNPPQGTGDSPERRTSQSSFNPNATPFVPSRGTFPASQAHPIECGSFTPGWLSSFWEGTTTAIPAEQELHAKQMIDSCATPSTYGPFARAVYDALNETCGTWESSCFRFYLQKSAFDSFNHSWLLVKKTPSQTRLITPSVYRAS